MLAGQAARAIGRACQGNAHTRVRRRIGILRRIPHSIDVGVRRPHVKVSGDAAAGANLQPGVDGKLGTWAHTQPQQHNICRKVRPVREDDPCGRACRLLNRGDPAPEFEPDAVRLDFAVQRFGHFGVQQRQHLRQHLDQRYLQAALIKLLRHLKPDKPAAHYHSTLSVRHGRGDPVGVVQVAQRKHTMAAQARQRGSKRAGAGREDQLIVVLAVNLAGDVILHGHRLDSAVDSYDFLPRAHIQAEPLFKQLLRGDQQLGAILDLAAQIIGQPAVGEGHIGILLKHDNVRLFVHAGGRESPPRRRRPRRRR